MTYTIKVYLKKEIKGSKSLNLEYIETLPYRFYEKPVNICSKLNEMFQYYEHVIDVE